MQISREQIDGLVQKHINARIMAMSNVMESNKLAYVENGQLMLNESLAAPAVKRMLSKNFEKYKFIFFEKGDDRWVFGSKSGEIIGINFKGVGVKPELKKFNSEGEVNAFVKSLKRDGYRTVTRESPIKKFFKSIASQFGAFLFLFGLSFTVVMAFAFLVYVVAPFVFAAIPAIASVASQFSTVAAEVGIKLGVYSILATGGWLAFKFSEDKEPAQIV